MTHIPVYVLNYNRLEYVQQMLKSLESIDDVDPIVVDHHSTYPPVLDWYVRECPVPVIRLPENRGPRSLWYSPIAWSKTEYFAVTDPDLDISSVPKDVIQVLCDGLAKYPDIRKCGLSLEIQDLPNTLIGDHARQYESKYWVTRHDDRFWLADVSTTFAVYRTVDPAVWYRPALRSDRPYTARHMPWYITAETVTDEDWFYWQHLGYQQTLYWSTRLFKTMRRECS